MQDMKQEKNERAKLVFMNGKTPGLAGKRTNNSCKSCVERKVNFLHIYVCLYVFIRRRDYID